MLQELVGFVLYALVAGAVIGLFALCGRHQPRP